MLDYIQALHCVQIAIVAYTISGVLMQQDMLLERYLDLLIWAASTSKFGKFIAHPLGLCEKCLAGQVALWYFLYVNWDSYTTEIVNNIISHIVFICVTVLVTIALKATFRKWT